MCGRYSLTTPPEAMARLFRITAPLPNLPPRYNIAPTQDAPVVRPLVEGPMGRALAMLRWGLVPHWSVAPDSRYSMFNARAETVAEKRAFRQAFRQRRCLVPADGFYEWRKEGGRKQPYHIRLKGGGLFAFAGLWEYWRGAETIIESFAIIVTDANALLRPIHERMPVILHGADHDAWLDAGSTGPEDAKALLRPFPADEMEAHAVSSRVNSARHDDPACIAPVARPDMD